MGNQLLTGQNLQPGEELKSNNQRYNFILQGDGNLVLYDHGKAIWDTGTNGRHVHHAILQDDGNFVIYGNEGAIFNTETHGNPSVNRLILQDDGNVVIYTSNDGVVWDVETDILKKSKRTMIKKIENKLPLGNKGYARIEEFKIDGTKIVFNVLLRYKEKSDITLGQEVKAKAYLKGKFDLSNPSSYEDIEVCIGLPPVFGRNKFCMNMGDIAKLFLILL